MLENQRNRLITDTNGEVAKCSVGAYQTDFKDQVKLRDVN